MRLIGCDPGLQGSLAMLVDGRLVDVVDLPIVDRCIDCYTLTRQVAEWGHVDRVIVETPTPRPGQAVGGVFRSGANYGRIIGVLAALERPVTHVSPNVWTRALGVGADKGAHRRRAQDEWPSDADSFKRVKDDGRADAALIALWGWQQRAKGAAA
jgi:crossover junction endodeoxyribonuclease RuvC